MTSLFSLGSGAFTLPSGTTISAGTSKILSISPNYSNYKMLGIAGWQFPASIYTLGLTPTALYPDSYDTYCLIIKNLTDEDVTIDTTATFYINILLMKE